MKKLMFAVSAALCATVGFSDVTSANIVGYAVKDGFDKLAGGQAFTLMGLPFKSMKENGNWSLNDLQFSKLTGVMDPTKSDQIWLWVADKDGNYNYQQWRYRNAANGWRSTDGLNTPFDDLYKEGIPAGTAFWFAAYNATDERTFTGSGAVGDMDREIVIDRGEFQFVACPFPVQLNLNDKAQFDSSNCTGVMDPTKSDQIWLWVKDPETGNYNYQQWRYRNAANGWRSTDGLNTPFDTTYPHGMPVGAGFWFSSYANGGSPTYTITIKSPIAKPAAE